MVKCYGLVPRDHLCDGNLGFSEILLQGQGNDIVLIGYGCSTSTFFNGTVDSVFLTCVCIIALYLDCWRWD